MYFRKEFYLANPSLANRKYPIKQSRCNVLITLHFETLKMNVIVHVLFLYTGSIQTSLVNDQCTSSSAHM